MDGEGLMDCTGERSNGHTDADDSEDRGQDHQDKNYFLDDLTRLNTLYFPKLTSPNHQFHSIFSYIILTIPLPCSMRYHLLGLNVGSSLGCSISYTPVLEFKGSTGKVILNLTT